MPDNWNNYSPSPLGPFVRYFTITPHPTNLLPERTRSIYIGGAGNLEAIDAAGNTVVFQNLPAGFLLDIRTERVLAANTTCTNLVGMA
jgi:hypothetical protein